MDADLKKLKKIVSFMRKQGVLSYSTPEITLSLAPLALNPEDPKAPTPDTPKLDEEQDPLETLLWSAPGLSPELEHA